MDDNDDTAQALLEERQKEDLLRRERAKDESDTTGKDKDGDWARL